MNRPHPGLMLAVGALAYPAGKVLARILAGYDALHPDKPTRKDTAR